MWSRPSGTATFICRDVLLFCIHISCISFFYCFFSCVSICPMLWVDNLHPISFLCFCFLSSRLVLCCFACPVFPLALSPHTPHHHNDPFPESSKHQGRIRQFQHVSGNYPSHIFIQGTLTTSTTIPAFSTIPIMFKIFDRPYELHL